MRASHRIARQARPILSLPQLPQPADHSRRLAASESLTRVDQRRPAAMMLRARGAAGALLRLAGAGAGVQRGGVPPLACAAFARDFLDFRKVAAASSPFLLDSS